jgi:hypothetical protein
MRPTAKVTRSEGVRYEQIIYHVCCAVGATHRTAMKNAGAKEISDAPAIYRTASHNLGG